MSSLFSKPKASAPPKIEEPTPLPEPDGEQTTAARRRRVAKEKGVKGFSSTILSTAGRETLGG